MAPFDKFIEYQVYLMMMRISIPLLILLGTAGNTISLIVLLKPEQRRSSIARILTCLAVSDMFMLWIAGLYNWIYVVFDINIIRLSTFICKFYPCLTFFFIHLSSFLIAALTLNRSIAVLQPLKARLTATLKNTNILLTCLVIVCILTTCHIPLGLELTEQGQCTRVEKIYTHWVVQILIFIQLINFLSSITFVTIANICIIGRLFYRSRNLKKVSANQRSAIKATSKTSRTLVLVNVTYLICNVPAGAFFAIVGRRPLSLRMDQDMDHDDAVTLLFWGVSVNTFLFNNAINCALYFFSSSQFRKEVKKLFK